MDKTEVAAGPAYHIRAFCTGRCRIIGKYAFRNIGQDTDYPFSIYISVIQGNGLNALVDTGMESVAEMNRSAGFLMSKLITQEPGEDTLSIVRKAGLEPEDIHYVFLTHCHYDHCSNLPLFLNATVVIPSRAWMLWHADLERARYLHSGFYQLLEDWNRQKKVVLLDDGLVVPGIGVQRVGGHSPCSQFIYVNTARGVALFSGDTVQMFRNVEENVCIGIYDDEPECWSAIRVARRDADILIPGHDPRLLAMYPGGVIA
jgi:glyoxylase-like metal-dependent hydrolase (beta-lactamase superfamily II)